MFHEVSVQLTLVVEPDGVGCFPAGEAESQEVACSLKTYLREVLVRGESKCRPKATNEPLMRFALRSENEVVER